MKKIFILACIMLSMGVLPASAFVREYFNSFYYDYLTYKNISQNDMQNFDFLHDLSNDKVYWLNKALTDCNVEDKEYLVNLIDEEYHDLRENLDFESEYVQSSPLSRRQERKFKKAHKKFMRQVKKCSLTSLR